MDTTFTVQPLPKVRTKQHKKQIEKLLSKIEIALNKHLDSSDYRYKALVYYDPLQPQNLIIDIVFSKELKNKLKPLEGKLCFPFKFKGEITRQNTIGLYEIRFNVLRFGFVEW